MLIEVRRIIFPPEMLGEMLLTHCRNEGVKVPNSQLQNVKLVDGEATHAVLQFVSANPDAPVEIPLNETFVLAAMLASCRDYHVPVPRAAEKSTKVTSQGLAMQLVMKVNKPE